MPERRVRVVWVLATRMEASLRPAGREANMEAPLLFKG